MKAEIRERIEQIKNGEVPKGYKKTNGYIYSNEWNFIELSNYIKALKSGISVNSDGESVKNEVDKAVLKISCVNDGIFIPSENKKIQENELERAQETVKANNLLIVRKNTPDLVGNLCYVDKNYENLYLPDLLWQTEFHENIKLNIKWLAHFLSSKPMKRIIKMTATGTNISMKNITKDNFLELKVPKIYIEIQDKIENIISTWDTAIEKQQKLIELKKKQKKWLMQELLTGKKRLKGFSGEWKEVRLGELSDINKGVQLNRIEMNDECKYPALNGGIQPSGYTDEWNTNEDTITISEGGNSCGYVNYMTEKFWCGGHCYALNNLKADKLFLYHKLKFLEKDIMQLRVGSGLPNIQKKSLDIFKIDLPQDIEEQKAIAEILTTADQEVNLLEKELEAMKEQKKGMMQLLLTGIVRV